MTKKVHRRTVEIITLTITCEGCGDRSGALGEDTLLGRGWTLKPGDEQCPECALLIAANIRERQDNEARAKYIAALESGEPLLVHGRVYTENGVEFR